MTLRAVVRKLGVRRRDLAGVKKRFAAAALKKKNRNEPAKDRHQIHNQSRPTPWMQPAVVTEIALVTLSDLLLRACGFRHRLSI
jgi:hypothetical protein